MAQRKVSMFTQRVGNKRKKNAPIPPLLEDGAEQLVVCKMKRLRLSPNSAESDDSTDTSDSSDSSDSSDLSDSSDSSVSSDSSDVTTEDEEVKVEQMTVPMQEESDDSDDDWPSASMQCPLKDINNLTPTNGLRTEYCAVIPIFISTKPCHCNIWAKQFGKGGMPGLEKKMQSLSIQSSKRLSSGLPSEEKMNTHWDLFPTMMSFAPFWEENKKHLGTHLYRSIEDTLKEPRLCYEKYEDQLVQISDEITLVLRMVPPDAIKQRMNAHDYKNENVLIQLPMATHTHKQENIYLNEPVRSFNMAWILHLILNEKRIGVSVFKSPPVSFRKQNKTVLTRSVLTIYQALYAVFSQKN
jgi:hypothetical protein